MSSLLSSLYSKEIDFILKKLNIEIKTNTRSYYSDVSYLFNIVCEKNYSEAANHLLKYSPDINSVGVHNRRPLWWVVWNQNEYLLKILLKLKCEVNFVDKETGYSPLDLAVSKGNYMICKLLLETGEVYYPPSYLYDFIENPIFVCIKKGNALILQLLIEYGYSVNTTNKTGLAPLTLAIEYRNFVILNILLKNHANMNSLIRGYSPLRIALDQDLDEVIQLFVNYRLNVNLSVINGIHPLLYSVIMKAEKSAFVLITNGSQFPGDLTKLILLAYLERMWKFINLLILLSPGKYSVIRFKNLIRKSDCLIGVFPRLQFEKRNIISKLENESRTMHSLKHLTRISLVANFGCRKLYQLMKQKILPEKLFNDIMKIVCV